MTYQMQLLSQPTWTMHAWSLLAVHGRKEGNLAWTSGVRVLLTTQQSSALGNFWGSHIPALFESHLQPHDESTVVRPVLQMMKQSLGEVKRLLGDLYST